MTATVGLIANPQSGKDIRRLVAHASVFDNNEKVNILRRVLVGMAATGVRRVLYMPDPSRLVPRALDGLDLALGVEPVDGRFYGQATDTTTAAAAIAAAGAAVIVSLGGDGTNRLIARGAPDVPLLAVSTGTNNVFPRMMEGTVAGLAAGAVAVGAVNAPAVAPRCKWLQVAVDGVSRDLALIDTAVMHGAFVGSRAIWDLRGVREIVLTRAAPDAIGLAAVGGMLATVTPDDDAGLHLLLDPQAPPVSGAAIAPGVIAPVRLARVERIALGDIVPLAGPALLAFDGEREFSLKPHERATVTLARGGPPVIDVGRCLEAARDAGFLRRDPAGAPFPGAEGG